VLRIVSQMCASLSEAHNQGIIHRDIKPDNVYLVEMKGAGDYVKVLDFSVAKLDAPDAQVTRAGVVFGTPAYMSPEQGRGVPLDPRSDIYAVGIVAYECLMGKPPFDAKIPTEVVMMHLRDKPAPLAGVAPQISTVVMRALEKDPGKRQQTAEALDNECQACFAELFPRQTPGSGMQNIISPSMGTPAADQRTMAPPPPSAPPMGMGMGAPPPMAPPPMAPPRSAGSPLISAAPPGGGRPITEQATMMAGHAAPVVGAPVAEQKTMMAGMPAPVIGAPVAEQKTMMAGMPAPAVSRGSGMAVGAPPPAAPPLISAAPAGGGPPIAEQKTMMAGMQAPVVPQRGPTSSGAGASQHGAGAGTQILPDSQGVVAYAQEQARQVRELAQPMKLKVPPAGPLFWLAWIVLGVGAGLGVHFYLAHQAAAAIVK
jgi:serine/threonine-protein kinase